MWEDALDLYCLFPRQLCGDDTGFLFILEPIARAPLMLMVEWCSSRSRMADAMTLSAKIDPQSPSLLFEVKMMDPFS